MDELCAAMERHSVRRYDGRVLEADVREALEEAIRGANERAGLHIQLVCDEREAFTGLRASYGQFRDVANYLAIVGKAGREAERLAGYEGERLVLLAQTLGLNTCWVGGTFSKRKAIFACEARERLIAVIALGYGTEPGRAHRSRDAAEVATAHGPVPDWFANGVACALLAPTAINQQRFHFTLEDAGADGGVGRVRASTSLGPFTQVDLGIAMYHFELGAGRDSFVWA